MKVPSGFLDLIDSDKAVVALGGFWLVVACLSVVALLFLSLGSHL